MISTKFIRDILLLGALTFLSIVRQDLLLASVGSLLGYFLRGLSLRSLPEWNGALAEYWLAAIAWMVTGLWLLRTIYYYVAGSMRVKGWQMPHRMEFLQMTLAIFVFISFAAPIIAPLDPYRQGDLVTARMLLPLARGTVSEHVMKEPSFPSDWGGRLYVQGRDYLLNRTIRVVGGIEPSPSANNVTPVVFILGTDDNARDVLSRVIYGGRVSLGIGVLAALGAVLIGASIGFAAGMFRGVVDAVLMRLTDLFLAFPILFLAISVMAFMGGSVSTVVLVLSASGWMGIARVVRGEVIALREREFILAAQLLQVSRSRIILRHFLPNLRPVIWTSAALQFANAALGEAALGFLGLGIQPPTASWGNMMGEAAGYLSSAWWVGLFPGMCLAIVIVCAHALGERSASVVHQTLQVSPRVSHD